MNQQNEHPLCKQLGLNIFYCNSETPGWIYADKLEAILQKAVVVYGSKGVPHNDDKWIFSEDQATEDTHQALLINIKPIKEKTTLEKISEVLEKFRETNNNLYLADEIKKLIEDANEKRD